MSMSSGMIIAVAGIVEECKTILTKKGDIMAFARVADFSDNIEIVLFPETFTKFKIFMEREKCIAIKGKISTRNGGISIITEAVKEL